MASGPRKSLGQTGAKQTCKKKKKKTTTPRCPSLFSTTGSGYSSTEWRVFQLACPESSGVQIEAQPFLPLNRRTQVHRPVFDLLYLETWFGFALSIQWIQRLNMAFLVMTQSRETCSLLVSRSRIRLKMRADTLTKLMPSRYIPVNHIIRYQDSAVPWTGFKIRQVCRNPLEDVEVTSECILKVIHA